MIQFQDVLYTLLLFFIWNIPVHRLFDLETAEERFRMNFAGRLNDALMAVCRFFMY